MAAGGVFLALAAGLGVGGLVLYVQRQKAIAEPPKPKPKSDPCSALKDINQTAYEACQLINQGAGLIDTIVDYLTPADPLAQHKADIAKNGELNGEIDIPTHPAMYGMGWGGAGVNGAALEGPVVRFKNGCTPHLGSPGLSKCAPGTVPLGQGDFATSFEAKHNIWGSITGYGGGQAHCDHREIWITRFAQFMTGKVTRRVLTADETITLPAPAAWGAKRECTFPAGTILVEGDPTSGTFTTRGSNASAIPLAGLVQHAAPPGTSAPEAGGWNGGFYKGVSFVCPDGQVNDVVNPRDHRERAMPCKMLDGRAVGYTVDTTHGGQGRPLIGHPDHTPQITVVTDTAGDPRYAGLDTVVIRDNRKPPP